MNVGPLDENAATKGAEALIAIELRIAARGFLHFFLSDYSFTIM